MDRKPVELVRVPREEKYYDREAVLGRDAASVFPTEAKKTAGGALDPELVRTVLGGDRKFVSETELEEIKAKRGLNVEDGTIAADKPLAQILKEAKEAKEAAFQEQWKQMKTGKNRPLDEDEFEFLDSVAEQEAARLRAVREEEEAELAAFQALQQQAAEDTGPLPAPAGPMLPGEEAAAAAAAAGPAVGMAQQRQQQPKQQPQLRRPPPVRPLIKPVIKPKQPQQQGTEQHQQQEEPASKRQRTNAQTAAAATVAEAQQQEESEGPGLAGLLGGYGSGSDGEGSDA